jgi:hypothetical protein
MWDRTGEGDRFQTEEAVMKFLYPVPPSSIVTQSFAEHEHRREVNGWTNYNGGIDWGIPTGTSIKAAQVGTVTVVRNDATGYGTHVRIEHTEGRVKYTTIYGHLMKANVEVGDVVNAGDVIGKSDNTGNSTGPHLHFEIRRGTKPIDPAPLLVKTVAGLTSDETGEAEVPQGIGTEPAQFPGLPKARVLVATLNVRSGPSVADRIVGTLILDEKVEVLRKITQGRNIWLQIGYQQYIAQRFDGNILVQWL